MCRATWSEGVGLGYPHEKQEIMNLPCCASYSKKYVSGNLIQGKSDIELLKM